ncbi:L-rhamnose mutarotase [Pedobacter sp. Leaf132]|uniref:L-rhamnose mutarotase n=1 Tax=Pedobacter sp. Leaf132 TaxID=2876557 RepID=UPI001E58309D|nr:L-rhamnose mutarotase [Pedobacter sp. Leaf132]
MERIAFKMKLIKGFEEEYRKRHDAIWPELSALLKETGVSDYSIFLDRDNAELFAVLKIHNSVLLKALPAQPVMQKWWAYMSDIMETSATYEPLSFPLEEVFYLK